MFELSVACKYLLPRWRQLSVSIISIVSVLVISLVVWLIVVFFSVKDGLENNWIDKLVALTAPIRITPTEKYYDSYYYLIDSISQDSEYSLKTIKDKLSSTLTDPYNPEIDEEIPPHFPFPLKTPNGNHVDLVKKVVEIAASTPGLEGVKISDFETSTANLRLRFLRTKDSLPLHSDATQQFVEQASFIGSFDEDTKTISNILLSLTAEDLHNLLYTQAFSEENIQQDSSDVVYRVDAAQLRERLDRYFSAIKVTELKTPSQGWRIPPQLFPDSGKIPALAVIKNEHIVKVFLVDNEKSLQVLKQKLADDHAAMLPVQIEFENGKMAIFPIDSEKKFFNEKSPSLFLPENFRLRASLVKDSLKEALKLGDVRFTVQFELQGTDFKGVIPLFNLEIAAAEMLPTSDTPTLFAKKASNRLGLIMPETLEQGEGILLPKSFREAGALLGDHGYLSYYSLTPSSVQEQRLPVYVAGFYDPGIIPIGGKYLLASRSLISALNSAAHMDPKLANNGINLRFENIKDIQKIKEHLSNAFEKEGISSYWKVQTFREYPFTKDIIQQLHSEKNLFSIISLIIIIVACSNIISMLIILVNDKKKEIGILRALGASSKSIGMIFGFCGIVMGTVGSVIGIIAALLTLYNLDYLVGWLSYIQGHDLFNPLFFGETLPNQLSTEALAFVVFTTALVSLLAGIVPAVKASSLRPSAILRSE